MAIHDKLISSANVELLRYYLNGNDRSLVFFVGAGASLAGNTGMPSTPSLLFQLLVQALLKTGRFAAEQDELTNILKEISSKLGFEITLNDFWQICRDATTLIYQSFDQVERHCLPNRVHSYLAHWLASGGVVVTTNYDRLIEREWHKLSPLLHVRYSLEGLGSFVDWENNLNRGSVLFKVHGSLDDPNSCLGALEHVGTKLVGDKGELLTRIVETRPLCFVGWRGVDPDIPPLLAEALPRRDSSLPIYWVHHEGYSPDFTTLEEAINSCTLLIKPLASKNPILTEADRLFGEFWEWLNLPKELDYLTHLSLERLE